MSVRAAYPAPGRALPIGVRASHLALGVRFAVSGGRGARLRTALTAIGVGVGVALLLVAASLPALLDAHEQRQQAVAPRPATRSERATSLRVADADTTFQGRDITGLDVHPRSDASPRPPGVRALPEPGAMVVSPALAELLHGRQGDELRHRLDARAVGTIGDAGLTSPDELRFYRGADASTIARAGSDRLVGGFGVAQDSSALAPILVLVAVVGLVVLLLPVAVFVAAAIRFGGEDRDRRLAALRLVGADRASAIRVAAGETLLGAVFGLLLGGAMFAAARPLAERVSLAGVSVFSTDMRPSAALVGLIVVLVPATAIGITAAGLRRVVIEPLGVVRRSAERRRRLWWRLVPLLGGAALIAPRVGRSITDDAAVYQVAAGVLLVLVAISFALPWILERAIARAGAGGVAWQMAIRRLQVTGGTTTRVAGGLAVAVAGAIALQTLFFTAERVDATTTGANVTRAQVGVQTPYGATHASTAALEHRVRAVPGVAAATGVTQVIFDRGRTFGGLLAVGRCRDLAQYAQLPRCRDGDTFVLRPPGVPAARAGDRVRVDSAPDGRKPPAHWTIPRDARRARIRPDPAGGTNVAVLATPAAVSDVRLADAFSVVFARVGGDRQEAIDRIRDAVAPVSRYARVDPLQALTGDRQLAAIRRALLAGAVLVLLLIGASLLVAAIEQLRERRRPLAVLAAFGARRRTVALSVLWQTAVPVGLGLLMSAVVGLALGAALVRMIPAPLEPDWGSLAAILAAGAAAVLGVTALSMPLVWRLTRPDNLRSE